MYHTNYKYYNWWYNLYYFLFSGFVFQKHGFSQRFASGSKVTNIKNLVELKSSSFLKIVTLPATQHKAINIQSVPKLQCKLYLTSQITDETSSML